MKSQSYKYLLLLCDLMRDSLVKYGLISWHRIITLFRSTPHRASRETCGASKRLGIWMLNVHVQSHLHPRKKRILPILCALRIVLLVFWIHFACHAKIMLRFLPPCRSARRLSRLYLDSPNNCLLIFCYSIQKRALTDLSFSW